MPQFSLKAKILASRWPHDERLRSQRQCAFYLYKRSTLDLVAFFTPIFAKSTEHPSQCVDPYAHPLAGPTHFAQTGCAGRLQAYISVNAISVNRLHPKPPPARSGPPLRIRTIPQRDQGLGPSPITRHSHIDQRSISIQEIEKECTYVRRIGRPALSCPLTNARRLPPAPSP